VAKAPASRTAGPMGERTAIGDWGWGKGRFLGVVAVL